MATYNYTVTASGNDHYLWNGHGLIDAADPHLFFRAGDIVNITNASGGHPMRITNNASPSVGPINESNGAINVNPVLEGAFTYVCTSHAAMTGQITVSAAYANEGPEDGYGTGPLIGHDDGPLSMNEIRTKINEIITKGGVGGTPGTGGGSISVQENAPNSPSDGDLWWDEDTASLYVYFADRSAWIQTNGAVGGGGSAVKSGPQTITLNSEIAFDHGLGDYPDLIEGYLTCTQAEFGYQPGDRLLVSSNYFSDGTPGSSQDHGVSFNATATQAIALIGENIEIPSRSNPGTSPSIADDGIGLSNWKLEIVAMKVSGGGGGGGTPAGADRQLQFNDNGTFGANADLKLDGSGNLFVPRLAVGEGNASGDEGGEITLKQSVTNNTLVGDWVYMDIYGNQIRFFEDGAPYKGAYIDLSQCADGVGTNLLAGGGASVTTSASVPASPSDGDLWFNTTQAELYVYVDAENAWIQTNGGGGSGGGNFSTGWVQTDDASNSVTNGATLTFNHNLGSTDLLVEGYVSSTGSDSNAIQLTPMNRYGNTGMVGYKITGMTSNTVTIQLAAHGYGNPTSSGGLGNQGTNFANEYIKFVISAGGGGAGPRAYVEFDGTAGNMTNELNASNSLNVSSITDGGTGVYTITFTSPVTNPVVNAHALNPATALGNNHVHTRISSVSSSAVVLRINGSTSAGNIGTYADSSYVSLIVH